VKMDFRLSMILSENRFPSPDQVSPVTGFFGIML
jgi:hypothetical protein